MNWQKKTPEGQTLYRTLSLHIHGGGKIKEEKIFESKNLANNKKK